MGQAAACAGVVRWLEEVDEDRVFLSVISLAEIRVGIERLASGRRRAPLDR
jgi:predicted nucleic acid-binding protein